MPDIVASAKKYVVRFLETTPSWQIGLALIAVAASMIGVGHLEIWSETVLGIVRALGEAVLIAGILALLIDPFLKARLLREASKSIFEHMIGFDHEPELKAKLRSIVFETKLYRKDCKISSEISLGPEGRVTLSVSIEHEIVNQSLDNVKYKQAWDFVDGDAPRDAEFAWIVGEKLPESTQSQFQQSNLGYLKAEGPSMDIEPHSHNIRYRFIAKCKFDAPWNYYHPFYLAQPTIDITISVKAPEHWKVWIGGGSPQVTRTNEALWHSSGILMIGDHVEVHWRAPDPA
jgi:hypothetical protein